MTHTMRSRTLAVAVIAAFSLAVGACGTDSSAGSGETGSSGDLSGSLTVWAWDTTIQTAADNFMEANPDVTVEMVNAGSSNDQYTALQNAISAGSGIPDVAQIEYYALGQFSLNGSLADLGKMGASDLADTYTTGPWDAVTQGGDAVYGLPLDSGPMAMFYNKKVFDELGIEVPTTWDEYAEAGRAMRASGKNVYIANDTGDAGTTLSTIWQAGGKPYTVDGTEIGVDFSDEGSQKYATAWNEMLSEGLFAPITGWTDEWYKGLGNGTIATLTTGAWMPGNFTSGVPDAAGDWRVAPMPQWEEGAEASAENGGSALVVMDAAEDKELAYAFVKYLSAGDGIAPRIEGGGFPATVAELESEEFLNTEFEYFGGQKANKVFAQSAANVVEGWTYLPYQAYANSIFNDTVGKAYATNGSTTIAEGLTSWADATKKYGEQQGFTIIP